MTGGHSTSVEARGRFGVSRSRREFDFDGFYLETSGRIYRLGWLLAGSEGEDLAAEAYVRALARWPDLMTLEHPEAWVRKVLINLCTSWKRRIIVGRNVGARVGPAAEHTSFGESTAERLTLRAAIDELSPRQRAAVVLRHYEDLTLAETASALGCSVSTANTHLRRAYATLAEKLGQGWATEA